MTWLRLTSIFAVLVLVAGCGGTSSTAPTASAVAPGTGPAATTAATSGPAMVGPVKIAIGAGSTGSLPVYAAERLGLFNKAGVQVEIVLMEDSAARVPALLGKAVDFVINPPDTFLSAAAGGGNAKTVSGILNVSVLQLVVQADITDVRSLKGKTGATFFVGHTIDNVGNRYLSQAGLDPAKDVTWLAAANNAGIVAAMKARRAQFSFVSAPTLFQLQDSGFKVITGGQVSELVYPTLSLITRQDVIAADPLAVERVVKAVGEATDMLHTDVAKGAELLGAMLQNNDKSVVKRTYDWYVPNIEADCVPVDGLDRVKADLANDSPNLATFDVAKIIDNTFVQKIAAAGGKISTKRCKGK